jgi:hypothetical protein
MDFKKPEKKKSKFKKCKCGNETTLAICDQCGRKLQDLKVCSPEQKK